MARSHGEARTTFHRAFSELERTLKRDRENGPPEPTDDEHDDVNVDVDGDEGVGLPAERVAEWAG